MKSINGNGGNSYWSITRRIVQLSGSDIGRPPVSQSFVHNVHLRHLISMLMCTGYI